VKPLALVPYFGGISTATHSRTDTRRDYLEQTLKSLAGFDVIVGVCRIEPVWLDDVVWLDTKPEWLPAKFMRWAQLNLDADLVYVTEADQILTLDPALLTVPNERDYLVPHRLNAGGSEIVVNGVGYLAPNGLPEGDGEFYHPSDNADCFGGAFLATWDLFRRVDFKLSKGSPVEHATGFDVANAGECLKTTVVERCWVEHLSSREHV
jgi:hypothetical protein